MTLLEAPVRQDQSRLVGRETSVPAARPTPTPTSPTSRTTLATTATVDPSAVSDRAILTGFVKGSIVGAVIVFCVCAGITVAAGFGWGPAIGVGAFTAAWGGPGFGGMLGAVLGHAHAGSG